MILKKETGKCLDSKKLKKLNRVFGTMLLCISLGLIAPSIAKADEVTDAETESDQVFETEENSYSRVFIYAGCKYDSETDSYSYAVEGVAEEAITASILNETYTHDTVWVNAAGGINYTVYKDGEIFTDFEDGRFYDPGEYAISIFGNNGKQEVPLKFTILGHSGNFKRFDFPSTCRVNLVRVDGEDVPSEMSYVELTRDGTYEIIYSIPGNGKEEIIKINIDNTAPTLKIEGLDEKKEASGPVSISKQAEEDKVFIYINGKKINYREKLVDSGRYRIVVQDEASNKSVYEFTILPYFNFSSLLFIAFCILIVVGIGLYVVFLRKNLRVR